MLLLRANHSGKINDDLLNEFAEAIAQLHLIVIQEEQNRQALFSICGVP
ncbi:MAG: hypothetical protein KME55_41595 [Nostoc indistinguendum CM1-VF10]|jgi:hypothetical protein|nr:hypothetical protein [Nostoc indistinguendum CM1-VF10]